MTALLDDFAEHPFAPHSARFPLGAPRDTAPSMDVPSPEGIRPFGLRDVVSAAPGRHVPASTYDDRLQMSVTEDGGLLCAGDPSADTTATVDGEDGPSSEDWDNDFCHDGPQQS